MLPRTILRATSTISTNAAGNGSATIIAAPGPNLAIRVWAWGAVMQQAAPATGVQAFIRHLGAATNDLGAIGLSDDQRGMNSVIPGGIQCTPDTAVQAAVNVNPGAIQDVHVEVYYTIERV